MTLGEAAVLYLRDVRGCEPVMNLAQREAGCGASSQNFETICEVFEVCFSNLVKMLVVSRGITVPRFQPIKRCSASFCDLK